MKTPAEWRTEAMRAYLEDVPMAYDQFILAVQREAFDAGACAVCARASAMADEAQIVAESEIDPRAAGYANACEEILRTEVTKLPGRP